MNMRSKNVQSKNAHGRERADRPGIVFMAAATLCATLLLGGCARLGLGGGNMALGGGGDAPQVAGNSFDRAHALGKAYPDAERVIISYAYGLVESGINRQRGLPIWLYVERGASVPQNFVVLSLSRSTASGMTDMTDTTAATAAAASDMAGNDVARLLTERAYCFDTPAALDTAGDNELRAYGQAIGAAGFALSGPIYIQQFLGPMHDDGRARLAATSIQNIGRDGQNCGMLGDLADRNLMQESPLARARLQAERAFDFSG